MASWWKPWTWRRKKFPSRRWPTLREFVYLDEVSVTSLVSSRFGKVPSEFTDTLTESMKTGVNSSINASSPILKSNIGSSIESSWTQDTKVLSKATIQATFKRLYDAEAAQLALSSIDPSKPILSKKRKNPLTEPQIVSTLGDPWLVDPVRLERGALAEITVELQADPTFRLSAVVAAYADLTAESEALSAELGRNGLEKLVEINRILNKLMVGLVPLKCRMVDYVLVEIGDHEYLMHRRAFETLPSSLMLTARDVYLVGVAEQTLFWRDIRRVLFSGAQFHVLCRLNSNGLSRSWTPVKLAHVFGEIAPGLEQDMALFSSGAFSATVSGNAALELSGPPSTNAVVRFSDLLSEAMGITINADEREIIGVIARQSTQLAESVTERRKVFSEVVDLLAPRKSHDVSPEEIAELRTRASEESGLLPGSSTVNSAMTAVPQAMPEGDNQFIDAEIIAIYW